MKKSVLMLLLILTAGCGGNNIVVREFDSAHVLHCRELQKIDKITDLKNYAGYLDKGDIVPMELNIDNDIIGVRQKSIDLVIKQKLYFMAKIPENPSKEELAKLENFDKSMASMSKAEQSEFFERYMLYVSVDAVHWAPVYDGKALKYVSGIKRGTFFFGVGADKKDGVKSVLTVKTER